MDLANELNRNLRSLQLEIQNIEDEIFPMSGSYLTQEIHQGKPVLVIVSKKNGKRYRRTVSLESPDVQAHLRNMILDRKLNILKHNEATLSHAVSELREPSTYTLMSQLASKFPLIPEAKLLSAFEVPCDPNDWASQSYEQSDYMPEGKCHITSRGLRLRSKSEVLIVEMLYDYKLPPRYEQVLHFGSSTLIPDFTIRRADGKIFYWEHMGLMNSREYRDHQTWKIQTYINNGITPWNNLIITYDNAHGDIDTRIIRSEIENKLLSF